MKYSSWEGLARTYDTLPSLPGLNVLTPYLERVLDSGDSRLVMSVSEGQTSFCMENRIGTVYLGDEAPEVGVMIAKVFFNVMDQGSNKVCVFNPKTPRKGFSRIGMPRGEVHLEAICTPSDEGEFVVVFIPVEIGRGVFLSRFFSSAHIATLFDLAMWSRKSPSILAAESDQEACVLMEAMITLATPLRPVMAVSSQYLPRIPVSTPARIIRVGQDLEDFDKAMANLPPPLPGTLCLVDARSQDPAVVARHARRLKAGLVLISEGVDSSQAKALSDALGLSDGIQTPIHVFDPRSVEGEGEKP